MPDVGLFTASDPISSDTKVVIKYSVEVGGLPVYQESFDVRTLAAEWARDPQKARELWHKRLTCPIECVEKPRFSANLTACLHP